MNNKEQDADQQKHTSSAMMNPNFTHAADLAANRQHPEELTPSSTLRVSDREISINSLFKE